MIFVLGGGGFIGSAICRYLESHRILFQSIVRENYLSHVGKACDIFINANGNSKKYIAEKDPLFDFDLSVRSVRSSIHDFNFKKYVYLSSCDIYEDCSSDKTTQEDFPLSKLNVSTYGFHKYLAEEVVKGKCQDWVIARMGGFVGTGLKKNPVFDILHNQKLWLHPDSQLQYLNVNTFANILIKSVCQQKNQTFNIAGHSTLKLRDLMEHCNYVGDLSEATKLVTYNISIEKIKKQIFIPNSVDEVFSFVKNGS
jgi:nucleoside-diphosphate-sugar epimerase